MSEHEGLGEIDREYLDACSRGSLPDVQAALDAGANRLARGDFGENGLHRSTLSGNPEMMQYLLNQVGLPKDARDDREQTPAHWAAKEDNAQALYILSEHGADMGLPNASGMTPRHLAEYHDCSKATEALDALGSKKSASAGFAERFARGDRASHKLRVVDSRSETDQGIVR